MKSKSDTVRKKQRVEILEDRKKTGCQDELKISFVLTENDDADIGTLMLCTVKEMLLKASQLE